MIPINGKFPKRIYHIFLNLPFMSGLKLLRSCFLKSLSKYKKARLIILSILASYFSIRQNISKDNLKSSMKILKNLQLKTKLTTSSLGKVGMRCV